MENINIDELSKNSDELMELITETNNTLSLPQSHLREDFQAYMGSSGAKNAVAYQMSKAVSGKSLQEVLIVGGTLAAAYVGQAAPWRGG